MKQGHDIVTEFPGILIIHQKITGYATGIHRHNEHEFFLPLQGEIHLTIGEVLLKAGPGRMICLPSGSAHSFLSSKNRGGERLIFLVKPKTWTRLGGERFSAKAISSSQLCKEILFHLMLHPYSKARHALMTTLVQTLSETMQSTPSHSPGKYEHLTGKTDDSRIQRALRYIEANYSEPLSSQALAKASGMSQRTLNRLFLTELGMTPKQALTQLRIQRAADLLKRTKISVTDVAFEVGYQSVSQFISTFRAVTGQLPSEFLVRRI